MYAQYTTSLNDPPDFGFDRTFDPTGAEKSEFFIER
jgi:hypothetical protein